MHYPWYGNRQFIHKNFNLLYHFSDMLEVTDLWKVYRSKAGDYIALNGVSFTAGDGDFVAVVGPSGSGKTTLLNLLGALDTPTRGDIVLDGVSYSSVGAAGLAELRKRLGFVFQTYNLLPHLTAMENVELPAIAAGIPPEDRRARAVELLKSLGLGDKLDRFPAYLSGGEQQRVAIARALINDPKLILADEPTGNLDSRNAQYVAELLQQVNRERGKTIVLVTHNMEIARYAKRIFHLRDGRIVKEEVVAG
jgi:putative ABC transport system ATP-binding protein